MARTEKRGKEGFVLLRSISMRIAALVLLLLVAVSLAAKKDKKDTKKKVGGMIRGGLA